MNEKQLLEYAIGRFEQGAYDEALEAFVLAYCKGYECEWIIENIYACYMQGNEPEFHAVYASSAAAVRCAYEDCVIDFIPYKEGSYYLFDKEQCEFRGVFSIAELEQAQPDAIFEQMEFSAAALAMDWNWGQVLSVLTEAKRRKLYAICSDMKRSLSFFKVPELAEYMKNVMVFADEQEFSQYFHTNTSVYLPHAVFGNEADKETLTDIIDREHAYRLTPEGRSTDHVFLTIAIPTANRGNLVKKRMEQLLQTTYDAEIEITISKNCMDLYQEEYDEIGKIKDARLHYHDHGKALAPQVNWHYAVEMAHGKYAMFVSDEDEVQIYQLEHYLRLLADHPDVSVMRAKTAKQYQYLEERTYAKQGREAFEASFLAQNYLSGLIVRREDFLAEDFLQLERDYNENRFYLSYPHEWWCAMLCRRGAYFAEPVVLIQERDSVLVEESKKLENIGAREQGSSFAENTVLPQYATYESRLIQFEGQVEFIRLYMGDDMEGAKSALLMSIRKVCYLLELARSLKYEREKFLDATEKMVSMAIDFVDSFAFSDQQKLYVLQQLQSTIAGVWLMHKKWSDEEEIAKKGVEE